MTGFGPSFSQKDSSLAGFEELAMPLFNSLYNFARWLAQNQNDAEDLVQESTSRHGAVSHPSSLTPIFGHGYFKS
jgi:hypothetical protein